MNIAFFIAKRVISGSSKSFSRLIIRIAIAAVALGMAVMIVATSLISGFKQEITSKVFGFWGHVHIMDFEAVSSNAYEAVPVSTKQDFYPHLDTVRRFSYPNTMSVFGREFEDWVQTRETRGGVSHIQAFAQKIGVIKTKEEIEGIVLKGVGQDYDWRFFDSFIQEGRRLPLRDSASSRDILISEQTSKRLKLSLGDKFLVYFVKDNNQIHRRFQVSGIYKTGLAEYDAKFAIVDIREIQALYGWTEGQVSGFEVFIDDLRDLEPIGEAIYDQLPMELYSQTIKDMEPNIFGWLELQNVNEAVILSLMVLVGIINMITALIILILERARMVGILKAMGAHNGSVQWVFLYYGAYITAVGLLWGNAIGVGLCLLQKYGEIIKLPEEDYYVSVAPIALDFQTILLLNAGTLAITVLVLVIPSLLVRFITPLKAIRFS